MGFSGSANVQTSLSNVFFNDLLNNQWEETIIEDRQLYKATGKNLHMYKSDIFFKSDPELMAITYEFAADNKLFLEEVSTAWSLLVNVTCLMVQQIIYVITEAEIHEIQ